MIFDLDGTLCDSAALSTAAFIDALSWYAGRDVPLAEIQALFGPNEEGIIRTIVPDHWEPCLDRYLAFHDRNFTELVQPWPALIKLLERLQAQGARLAIVTARGPRSAAIILERAGLQPFFEKVICGSPLAAGKPAALLHLRTLWRAQRGQALYIGDSPNDMRSALQARCRAIGAAWDGAADATKLADAGAEIVFETPLALQAWLMETMKHEKRFTEAHS